MGSLEGKGKENKLSLHSTSALYADLSTPRSAQIRVFSADSVVGTW